MRRSTTQVYTRVTITDLKAVHRRFHPREQHRDADGSASDQSDPSCTITLDGDGFYLDLLFYNRKLRRLVAVELKVGDFKVAYKGQMELDKSGIHVAEYLTTLPPRAVLIDQLEQATRRPQLQVDAPSFAVEDVSLLNTGQAFGNCATPRRPGNYQTGEEQRTKCQV